MWVVPDEHNLNPGYEQLTIDHELLSRGLVPVASGMEKHDGASAIRFKNKYAALYPARLRTGQSVELPDALNPTHQPPQRSPTDDTKHA